MFWFVSDFGFPPSSSGTQVISALSVLERHGIATSALELPVSGVNSITAVLLHSSAWENLLFLKMLAQKGNEGISRLKSL